MATNDDETGLLEALLADPGDVANLVTWAASINDYLINLGLMAPV